MSVQPVADEIAAILGARVEFSPSAGLYEQKRVASLLGHDDESIAWHEKLKAIPALENNQA